MAKHDIDLCLINAINHIIMSEMEGKVDEEDSYYPTLQALKDLLEKVVDDANTETFLSKRKEG